MIRHIGSVSRFLGMLVDLWRRHRVPPHHAVADFRFFNRAIGTGRVDFRWSGLWDRRLPLGERLRFLATKDRRGLEYTWNPRAAQQVLRDKIATHHLLVGAAVATPPLLAVVSTTREGDGSHPILREEADLKAFLERPIPGGLVCKPAFGLQGADVIALREAGPDGLVHMDGTRWSVERLWAAISRRGRWASKHVEYSADFLIQGRAVPHPTLEAIHGDTLGCLRFVTMRFDDGHIGLLNPTWKIPVGDTGVDNLNYGALVAPVDVERGVSGRAMLQRTMQHHDRHPMTGAALEGVRFPDWAQACRLAREAMAPFPELRSLGFDLALTTEGPTIIEVNPFWGLVVMQACHHRGIVRGEFLRFLEELGADDAIRREARGL